MSQKPLVFISHITPEKEVAVAFKSVIEQAFLGMMDVFVSSDPESISMGGKWLDRITDGLKKCVVEIVIASPVSVKRPWINFEGGAGWVRDIPVIPLCHSGMTPDKLPAPLSSLQAGLATDANSLERVLAVLARALDCKAPDTNFDEFVRLVTEFEKTSRQLQCAESESLLSEAGGLRHYEIAVLVAAAELSGAPGDSVRPKDVSERMSKAGFREIAATLGIAGLLRSGLAKTGEEWSGNFADDHERVIIITTEGWTWLEENVDKLELHSADTEGPPPDEVPF